MNNSQNPYSNFDLKQKIKAVVYTVLFINYIYYIQFDISVAAHTLFAESTLGEIARAFATTIDESAWISLIIIYELETYALSDEAFTKRKVQMLNLIKFIFVLAIAHTPYAWFVNLMDVLSAVEVAGVTDLCQLVGMDKSYAYNLVYTDITAETCGTLSAATQFFYNDPRTFLIVQDNPGLIIERQLAWIDLIESLVWIAIIFLIEINVRLQDKNLTSGFAFSLIKKAKILLYSSLWFFCAYWIYRGHFMFAFDEAMWIAGFFAIEMNLSDWRKEIRSDASDDVILK